MTNGTKIIFVLIFSAFASTFANAAYLQNASEIRTRPASVTHMNNSTGQLRGAESMAYAPVSTGERYPVDFGIGSQRK
jgi:hypothetical protein